MKTLRLFTPLLIVFVLIALAVLLPEKAMHAQQGTAALGVNGFNCVVTVSTATTIQAVGGSCVAPGANVRLYITDIEFSTNAAAIAADAFPTLKTGTGGTCGSNTSIVWQAMAATAATQITYAVSYTTPIRLPLNQELCWINSTAGSKVLQVHGYIAP